MCGVIGVDFKKPIRNEDLLMIKQIFIESQIRGKHSTGLAWYENGKLYCEKANIPAKAFVEKFNWYQFLGKPLKLIGHTRYSTSHIEYAQPIGGDDCYIVLNGVITQAEPYKWEKMFGFKCVTKNDTELLYRYWQKYKSFEDSENLLKTFPGSSLSVCYLTNTGELGHFRNSLRPQWVVTLPDEKGKIIVSTLNIAIRSLIPGQITKVKPLDKQEKIPYYMNAYKQLNAKQVYLYGWLNVV